MSKPIVAIVGRQNVGKSSLFNRLVKKNIAVVHDIPGVTRDRVYADVDYHDRTFTIVDTGGLVPFPDDNLIDMVRLQAQTAIDEAAVILFVVDVIEGVTPQDMMIADLLRKTQKPLFVVANKADNPNFDYSAMDFYQLGLNDPIPVSAIHNTGIGDLLAEIIVALPPTDEEATEEMSSIKIAVVGRPNAGKSSLINAILGEERVIVDSQPGTTRDAVNIMFQRDGVRFELIDTAGLRRQSRITNELEQYSVNRAIRSVQESDVAWLVLDATREISHQDKSIANFIADQGRACILAVTKWDLVEKDNKTHKKYTEELQYQLPHLSYVPVLFVSAVTRQRVMKLLDLSLMIHREYSMRIPTHQLNVTLSKATSKHQPPIVEGKRPSLKYITQVDIKPPTFVIFTNHPTGISADYESYLVSSIREDFGFLGTPIRIQYRQSSRN
ncbi:ribosome biogenesis GTPase Der [Candidatus Poribacteria bacterium]|nr:ribosome biogenesis GTPase Der [Candidatus Poribacteria bacterium]